MEKAKIRWYTEEPGDAAAAAGSMTASGSIDEAMIPFLLFRGNCEEAVHTYIDVFGGEIVKMKRWSDDHADMPPERTGKVMRVEFVIGGTRMAAGDSMDGAKGNVDIELMVHMDTEAEALYAMFALAEGGSVLSPLEPYDASDGHLCRSVTKDRFGLTWIITYPNPARQYICSDGIVWIE